MDNNNQPTAGGPAPTPTTPTTPPDPTAAPATTPITPTEPATTSTPSAAPTPKKPLNKTLIIVIVAAIIAVIAAIVATVIIINSGKDDNSSKDQNETSQESNDSNKDKDTAKKTLSLNHISLEYPSKDWKIDNDNFDDADEVAIHKGEDQYILLAYTSAGDEMTTEEFAELSAEAYDQMGFDTIESIKKQTINGKEWRRTKVYSAGVYLTILFLADGEDYYMVTYGSDSKSVGQDIEDILNTLKLK